MATHALQRADKPLGLAIARARWSQGRLRLAVAWIGRLDGFNSLLRRLGRLGNRIGLGCFRRRRCMLHMSCPMNFVAARPDFWGGTLPQIHEAWDCDSHSGNLPGMWRQWPAVSFDHIDKQFQKTLLSTRDHHTLTMVCHWMTQRALAWWHTTFGRGAESIALRNIGKLPGNWGAT